MDTREHAWDLLVALSQVQRNHLTDQDVSALNIQCTDLDLSTGEPADGSAKFIVPFPIDQVRELLKQKRPWVRYWISADKFGPPLVDAVNVLDVLIGSLCFSEDGGPSLIDETDWNTRPMQYEDGEILLRQGRWPNQDDGPDWTVTWVLDKMDNSTPHVSCLLADNALLRDDQLSNAEIWCILIITYYRLQSLPEFYDGRIIPVTVISCSDRMLRIVQGYVDGQGCI